MVLVFFPSFVPVKPQTKEQKMNATELKSLAKQLGADLVGIAPRERWADLPPNQNPLSIMPQCQSVIVLGRKILRGAFRGVEEGTNFGSTYNMYGQSWMEFTFMPRVVIAITNEIESTGAEAVPMSGGTPAGENVSINVNTMANLAGLGAVGKGGFFLTRQYGIRQRFAYILTDAVLDGDPIDTPDFCDDCDACIKACPLNAYRPDNSIDTKFCNACSNGRTGGSALSCAPLDRFAASCGRACIVATEDKIQEKFSSPFRKRAVWTRDFFGVPTVTPLEDGGK